MECPVPASVDSLFRIASLTRPITASAVPISKQAGRRLRSDKANRFLPNAEPAPPIDQLIQHIPSLDAAGNASTPRETVTVQDE